ncbi:GTPase HflX [Deltaproteobacteria bacterium TL4]
MKPENERISLRKAILVAIQLPEQSEADVLHSLEELKSLATTMGCTIEDTLIQARPKIHPGTYIGKGKLQEIKELVEQKQIETVIVDAALSPKQYQTLEKALECLIYDRTQVILEIFGINAQTREAKLQISLAQAEYLLPRLVGMWQHLDRERGGISLSRGTGEKQIEKDRQVLKDRITQFKQELKRLENERNTQKKRRQDCLQISLIGYTNAGKSTLMNALTHSDFLVEDKLFATLESTTRLMDTHNRPKILLSDTVGFIRNLPHELVASFRSTLEIIRDADLLLHVVDVNGDYEAHIKTTVTVLEEIGAHCVPVLLVFNKIDQLEPYRQLILEKKYEQAIFVSASSGQVEALQKKIITFFEQKMETLWIILDYQSTHQLAQIYEWTRVDQIEYKEDGIHLKLTALPENIQKLCHQLKPISIVGEMA